MAELLCFSSLSLKPPLDRFHFKDSRMPLSSAAENGHEAVVKLLFRAVGFMFAVFFPSIFHLR
jgi:hypothetical protein